MQTENAVKKLEKAGFTRSAPIQNRENFFSFAKEGHDRLVEFIDQRGSAICIGFRHKNDHSDSQSDYCASIFCDNISQAMRLAIM